MNLLTAKTKNFDILNVQGGLLVTVRNGRLNSQADEIFEVESDQLAPGGHGKTTLAYLPPGAYQFKSLNREKLNLQLIGESLSASVLTTCPETVISVNDRKRLNVAFFPNSKNHHIEVTLSSASSSGVRKATFAGTAFKDNALIAEKDGKRFLKNAEGLNKEVEQG